MKNSFWNSLRFLVSTAFLALGLVLNGYAIIKFTFLEDKLWQLNYQNSNYQVTFDVDVFEGKPSVRFMSFGEPLFEELLGLIMNNSSNL